MHADKWYYKIGGAHFLKKKIKYFYFEKTAAQYMRS